MTENNQLLSQIAAQAQEIELLKETLHSRALELDDAQWTLLSGLANWSASDDGLTLDDIHRVSPRLREMSSTNPWHIRGQQLRHSYVFGRGMQTVDSTVRVDNILKRPENKRVLFSVDGYFQANAACFNEGQYIVFYNRDDKRFRSIPFSRISGVITHPDDDAEIWFVRYDRRTQDDVKPVWVPTGLRRRAGSVPRTVNQGEPVAKETTAYIRRSNHQTGWTWGVPDSLGAMVWTEAYSQYLQGNARLVQALSRFAWTITQKTQGGVKAAAAQVRKPGEGNGDTTILAAGNTLASVGVPSAQVNMNNGQPLAAAIAASMGVPVIALLSSPGATGGSYGAAETLSDPTIKGFEGVQDSWKSFYEEILFDLGARDASVEFPSISTDAPYRQITSLASMVELGILWPEEVRESVLDIMDVEKLRDELPPRPQTDQTVVSSQGNSGALGATTNPGGDTNHDNDVE